MTLKAMSGMSPGKTGEELGNENGPCIRSLLFNVVVINRVYRPRKSYSSWTTQWNSSCSCLLLMIKCTCSFFFFLKDSTSNHNMSILLSHNFVECSCNHITFNVKIKDVVNSPIFVSHSFLKLIRRKTY